MHTDIFYLVHQKNSKFDASILDASKILVHLAVLKIAFSFLWHFFWKTVEDLGIQFLDRSKSSCTIARSLEKNWSASSSKNRYFKRAFFTKNRSQEVALEKSAHLKNNVSQSLEQEKGYQIELFLTLLRHFSTNNPGPPILKPGAKQGIYCEADEY